MNSLSLIEIFARTIPEGFLYFFASYFLTNTKINSYRYFISTLFLTILTVILRMAPIHYGLHTLFIMIGFIIINKYINNINTIKSIHVSVGIIAIEYICEIINILLLKLFLSSYIDTIFNNIKLKILCAIPSHIFFIMTVFIVKFVLNKYIYKNIKNEINNLNKKTLI